MMKTNSIDFKEIFSKKKVVLAPMAGITSFAYREFYRQFGIGLTYSEMISDCGLIYQNAETTKLLYTNNKESLFAVQLFGGNKENLVKAVKILESMPIKYDILDLNLACPVYKVTRNNGGSSWLKSPTALEELLVAIVEASSKPVSCKIRLGWDDNSINVYEIATMAEKAGVALLAVHVRTAKQGYTGLAQYEKIKDLKKYINIPFIVSGDIFSVENAKKAIEITGADAVMLARGGIGNPLLALEINNALTNSKPVEICRDFATQKKFLTQYMELLIEEKGEELAIRLLRGIAPKFFSSFPNSKNIRKDLSSNIVTKQDVLDILNHYETCESLK